MRSFLFFSFLCVFFGQSFASGWTPVFKISRLVAHDNGHVMVFPDPPLPKGFEGCANTEYFQLHKDGLAFKNAYSALLAAFYSQGNVVGWVSSCASPLYEGPLLTRVDLVR